MKFQLRNPGWAALLSFVLPGLGQAAGGKPARGAIISLPAIALFFVLLPVVILANSSLIGSSAGLTSLLVIDVLACAYHVWAIVDAYREIKPPFVQLGMRGVKGRRPTIALEFAGLVALVVATIGIHGFFGFLDYNSCTMRGRSCAQPAPSPIAAATASPTATASATPSGSLEPDASATPTPAATPSPPAGQTTIWKPIADRLRVHSQPASDSPTTKVLRQTQTITGEIVIGNSYTFAGALHSEWIKIDAGQPGAGGYVAAAYYFQIGVKDAQATPTPVPGSSPSPDGATPSPDGATPSPDGATPSPDGATPSPDGTPSSFQG